MLFVQSNDNKRRHPNLKTGGEIQAGYTIPRKKKRKKKRTVFKEGIKREGDVKASRKDVTQSLGF